MIFLAALFALQSAASAAGEDDIVVTARRIERLKHLNVAVRHDRRKNTYRCIVKRRSGDPSLDAVVCDAALACAPHIRSREEAHACMAPTMDALVARGTPWRATTDGKGR